MKKFLFVAAGLLLIALVLAVVAFFYIQSLLMNKEVPKAPPPEVVEDAALSTPSGAVENVGGGEVRATEPAAVSRPTTNAIPLSSLPLTDTQKSLLARAGIEYDTFIITPEMIMCAEGTLGAERFGAIVEGSSPSALETMSLLGCL